MSCRPSAAWKLTGFAREVGVPAQLTLVQVAGVDVVVSSATAETDGQSISRRRVAGHGQALATSPAISSAPATPPPQPRSGDHWSRVSCVISARLVCRTPRPTGAVYINCTRSGVRAGARGLTTHTPELVEPATRRAGCDELRRTRSLARAAPGSDGRTPRQD